MRRITLISLTILVLSGCDIAFGPEPTATPTPAFGELLPSPTFDIHPPTDLPVGVPLNMDGLNNPTAAAMAAQAQFSPDMPTPDLSMRPILITVPMPSGELYNAELWLPSAIAPGILLIGSTFEGWSGFPAKLREAGYAVLTVEGNVSADPVMNLRAIFEVMAVQSGIDPARILVIGSETGADAGFIGCAGDSRCLGAVLLSPQTAANLSAAIPAYNPRPVLLTASQEDSASLRAAQTVRQTVTGSALLQPLEGAGRGVQILLNRPDMVTLILEFLDTVTGR